MTRRFILCITLLPYWLYAQPSLKTKNYPSLLWEISGNGLTKPSWLFGTMHVSSKLAFHLADSFFLGIRNADVVALETNPESWQEDMSNYRLSGSDYQSYLRYGADSYSQPPNDYLHINTLKFYKYDKKIESALHSHPSAINNLLYRSYGNATSDFEEDTYLDMYIYQCAKKWGKKVAGVEKYGESMKLMTEAYKDAAKDRNIKERSYDREDAYSSYRLQEAYRSGNLDWLDSIYKYNSFSTAFDEKFLYKRNEIQAASIDSILRSGQSLFVGVGAAHLPGNRGVIEMLRLQGYRLRPVKMGARDSQHKSQVAKVRVAVSFFTQIAGDGMYKVDIPGKLYSFGEKAGLDQRQYADMANGSYYMVTRITTHAWMWGHSTGKVNKIIDSLLYENIPGKIIAKTKISRNGYAGIDLTNQTRRGDIQRYHIFTTPFEVIIFKISGTGDYVQKGEEANKFFASIQLKAYGSPGHTAAGWQKYSPPYGGFNIDMPHEPFISNEGSWIYDAHDKISNTQYRVIRTDIHNYHFAEEDSFDLGLMAESFETSEFIDKLETRKQTTYKGYPALECRYKDKNGAFYLTKFIIQGPHYYTLVAHGRQEAIMNRFLQSFEIKPYQYGVSKQRQDTTLCYTVKSPIFLQAPKEEPGMSENDGLENEAVQSKIIANDTTGEKIFVSFFKMRRYDYIKDSAQLDKENQTSFFSDSTGIIRLRKKYELPGQMEVWETIITDTGSSRVLWSKTFFKNATRHTITTQLDTVSQPSSFIQSFFDSFAPSDTGPGADPFLKKTNLIFADFMSSDSVAHARAVEKIAAIQVDSTDLPQLQKAISFLDWKEKKYLATKKLLIGKLDNIPTKQSADYLNQLYYAAGDTAELQHCSLEVLLQQKTQYAFNLFRDIMINEPPVLNSSYLYLDDDYSLLFNSEMKALAKKYSYDNGNFMDELQYSLPLTKTILPGLLPLVNLDDYKNIMMQLLAEMVDSNLINQKDYDIYFSKFWIEAKQELKKQAIAEKQKAIEKAEQEKEDNKNMAALYKKEDPKDQGNEKLRVYATLVMPYWETNPAVPALFDQLLLSTDKRLRYNTLLLLLRNKKPYPDSLLNYFAGKDDFRYELYTDLKAIGQEIKFPAQYNNHIDLAKSKLLTEKKYDKPDSLVYVDRLAAAIKDKKGFIYFFKYKIKKGDASWKIATAGLIPENPAAFEFDKQKNKTAIYSFIYTGYTHSTTSQHFSGFSDTKINEEETVIGQLNKELKRMLYSNRNSAREFYDKKGAENYYIDGVTSYEED